jgi:hypothetical protein
MSFSYMKVLHVIPSVSAVHGGPSRAIVDIERALAERGWDACSVWSVSFNRRIYLNTKFWP